MFTKHFIILFLTIFYLACNDNPTLNNDSEDDSIKTVQIGEQVWMAENLKVTHYRNGEPIPNVPDNDEWINLLSGAYCNYDNDAGNVATYGRLYNWYALNDSRGLAPEGWHVPSDEEWKQLEMFLGMSQEEADKTGYRGTDENEKLKETGTTHWLDPNDGTNESGFTALPGGNRHSNGAYMAKGGGAVFWTATEDNDTMAFYRTLWLGHSGIRRGSFYKIAGNSIRCIRND